MKNKIVHLIKMGLFIGVLVLALMVRKKDYAEIPIPGQSADEYSYSWVGLSLIRLGMPVGISGIDGYKHSLFRYINVDRFFQTVSSGDPLEINYPWMDHPPLLGLITGGWAYLSGARVFEDTTTAIIRKPIIIISVLSVALLMIYSWINFSFLTAIVAGALYATTPLIVLSGRMIQAENAIIPCILGVMICLSLYLKKKKNIWLVGAAVLSGLSTLFKLTGVVNYLLVFLVFINEYQGWNKKFMNDFGFFLAMALPISFWFVIYGCVYGGENFKNILFSNYNRFYGIGPNSIIELIRNQRLTQHKFLPETAIIAGWIVFLGRLMKGKIKSWGLKIVTLALLAYLMVYILFGSQPYGWYAFPFWPMLMIILAECLVGSFERKKGLLLGFLLSIMILGANLASLINVFEFQPWANYWRIGVAAIILILTLGPVLKVKKISGTRWILWLLIAAIVFTNIKYLNKINLDFWWQNIS